MNAIDLKAKWQRREPSPGMWMSLTDITVAEMIRDVGLDWVFIDTEHTAIDLQALQNLLIGLGDTPVIVRVPANDPAHIKRVLDMGASGVLVPHIPQRRRSAASGRRLQVPAAGHPRYRSSSTQPLRTGRKGIPGASQRIDHRRHHDRNN